MHNEIIELHRNMCEKKIRDFVDISIPAGNINSLGKPRDFISKSVNLEI